VRLQSTQLWWVPALQGVKGLLLATSRCCVPSLWKLVNPDLYQPYGPLWPGVGPFAMADIKFAKWNSWIIKQKLPPLVCSSYIFMFGGVFRVKICRLIATHMMWRLYCVNQLCFVLTTCVLSDLCTEWHSHALILSDVQVNSCLCIWDTHCHPCYWQQSRY